MQSCRRKCHMSARLAAAYIMSCIISYRLPSCVQMQAALLHVCLVHVGESLHKVAFSSGAFSVCMRVFVCVFVCVTWPCQSIFQCRPFHRQLPVPGPEIQWPHPQTAASVNTQTHTHTKHASYSKLKFANTKSMKKSCCQDSGCSMWVCVNTVCH